MGRYCLESAKTAARSAVLHEQSCPFFDLASLLAEGRINDVGLFRDAAGAVNSLPPSADEVVCCPHCCALAAASRVRHDNRPRLQR